MISDRLLGITAAGKPNHRGSSDPLMINPAMGFTAVFLSRTLGPSESKQSHLNDRRVSVSDRLPESEDLHRPREMFQHKFHRRDAQPNRTSSIEKITRFW
jgi:hypothetical protein